MNLPGSRHSDAWTYYEFGTRSFNDDIRALVIHDLDQAIDRDGITPELCQQATSGPLPFIPVPLKGITLGPEGTYPHRVSDVPKLMVTVDLNQHHNAFAHLLGRPELLAKIGYRTAREIALNLMEAVFSGFTYETTIAESRAMADRIHALSPDRQTFGLGLSQPLDFGVVSRPSGQKEPDGQN